MSPDLCRQKRGLHPAARIPTAVKGAVSALVSTSPLIPAIAASRAQLPLYRFQRRRRNRAPMASANSVSNACSSSPRMKRPHAIRRRDVGAPLASGSPQRGLEIYLWNWHENAALGSSATEDSTTSRASGTVLGRLILQTIPRARGRGRQALLRLQR